VAGGALIATRWGSPRCSCIIMRAAHGTARPVPARPGIKTSGQFIASGPRYRFRLTFSHQAAATGRVPARRVPRSICSHAKLFATKMEVKEGDRCFRMPPTSRGLVLPQLSQSLGPVLDRYGVELILLVETAC
jgi:hypothetical protein